MIEINSARSKKNGIVFQSTIFPMLSVETIRDNSGELHSTVIPSILGELLDDLGTLQEQVDPRKFKRITLIIDLLLIGISFFTRNIGIIMAALYFSILISRDLFAFIQASYQMKSPHGSERSTAKYHAAEHMVVNAYLQLNRVPTIEEAFHYSRFSSNCGSRIVINRIASLLPVALLMCISTVIPHVYIIALLILFVILLIARFKDWFKYLQIFITTRPTNAELEVAIEGLKQLEKLENCLTSDTSIDDLGITIRFIDPLSWEDSQQDTLSDKNT